MKKKIFCHFYDVQMADNTVRNCIWNQWSDFFFFCSGWFNVLYLLLWINLPFRLPNCAKLWKMYLLQRARWELFVQIYISSHAFCLKSHFVLIFFYVLQVSVSNFWSWLLLYYVIIAHIACCQYIVPFT